ncbi:MAG: phenylacetate--CoA ligase family protein [Deltaproteobacteria bacterium]|nr:phenylacetate--CoA ligase family protein [Deltaproteobacteria bacterium]
MMITPLEKWIANRINVAGRLDLKRLYEYQLERFCETLANVKKNSRFYKRHLAEVVPSDIRDMGDIARLPLTTPDDIASDPEGLMCVSPREVGRIVTLGTSGTTGRPKRVFFTKEDQELTMDFFHHGMMTMTDAHDIVMICMPGGTEGSVGDLLQRGLARFGCKSIVYGPIKDYSHALDMIVNEKITCIVGIPAQILYIARMSENSTCRVTLKSVLLSADYVPASAASVIKNAWGAILYEHYGMTEMGLGGGVACDAGEGYHLREADLLFEVINPVSGLQVRAGEYGEVVFSTLTRQGMPLIRYRTGDRGRFLTERCPCGSSLQRLDRITGRLAAPVTLADGNRFSITQLDDALYKEPSIVTYAAELQTVNGRDCLRIIVKPASGPADLESLVQRIKMELPSLFKEERLLLHVEEGDVDYFTTGTLKRKIIDSRL